MFIVRILFYTEHEHPERGLDELLDWVEGFDLDSGYNLKENGDDNDDWSNPASSDVDDEDDASSVVIGF